MSPEYDVIIAGAGLVGASLACALLQGGLNVALIEAAPPQTLDLQTWDIRTFALTRASERILENLGVWQDLARVSPFTKMEVWDANGVGAIHFDCTSLAEPVLGYIAEQRVLQSSLNARLQQFENLEIYRPATLHSLELRQDKIQVELSTGQHLQARLLVGAEGANSNIRTLAGIGYVMKDYAQQAIIANVQTELPHQCTAWQRFSSTGPLAFLPLYDPHHSSIVWSADTPLAQHLMQLPEAEFLEALGAAFAHRLGKVTATTERLLFPLQRRTTDTYIKPRIALVGDAAHTVHPLAGQGVNLGLLDVAALSEVLLQAMQARQDIGHFSNLRRYERWRKGNNLLVASAMSGFKHLFGSRLPVVQWARNFGLQLTDAATPVKQMVMRHAMGLAGDLPPLARLRS
ncbi:MAG: UbiH/UbiF/VisC/COQ6 family ubiquinone biosynthesis hydroxylase [Thiotrichaceae bacterium]|nr:UbiH/UbiF/VisC/COQ6 family ubiquinone biosynthesis hydroxylase [Thiotrichaceae bacterium]